MSAKIGRFYEFGNFRLDPQEKILFCDEKPLALTPKVFETLEIFVEHAGHLLAKDELIQRLWQDRFVEESNLTFNIKMLRKALQDNPRAPRFIETIPRRGYRFIAEVRENTEALIDKSETKKEQPVRAELPVTVPLIQKTTRSYISIAAVSVSVACIAVIGLWFSLSRTVASTGSAPILSTPFRSEKISNSGRTHALVTPDGKYMAYTNESDGRQSIWLRQLETGENIQIVPPSDGPYLGLAISHDGNSLYFVRRQNAADRASSTIYRVMTFGGIPQEIVEKTEGWISVSPDDKQISFVRCNYEDDDFCSLFAIGADGKNERELLRRKRPFSISDNQFSPDGKSIAFASGQSWDGGSDVRVLRFDLANGAETEISPKRFFDIRSVEWLPDGSGLLVAASESLDNRMKIWHVNAASGVAQPLTKDATDYISLSLDRLADKLIATSVSNTFRLFAARVDDLSHPRNVITARKGVALAPDGRIVYSGDDGNIWIVNRDGGEHRQLTNGSSAEMVPKLSPDGRFIYFSSNRSGTNQVWRMNADGSNQMQLTRREGGYPKFVTPDGKFIYYESCLHQNLFRVPTDGSGEESRVSEKPMRLPAFSPDGKLVAYRFYPEGNSRPAKIAVMDLETRTVVKAFAVPAEVSRLIRIAWVDNKSFYFTSTCADANPVWRQSLDADMPVLIGDLGPDELEDFTVSADGKEIGFIRGKWLHDAVLIEGLK
jgi:Tol biopolymer transport system component/DNA-binding winged helix-turn-helix (wHTH) protein